MQIALESLTKRFGSLRALEDISLTIQPGQLVAILGPNGAGKTTLLRRLSAIVAPDGGRILYDGERFNRGRIDFRQRLSFLPEFPVIFPQLSVARHIAMVLGLYNKDGDSTAETVTQHLRELDLLPTIDTAGSNGRCNTIWSVGPTITSPGKRSCLALLAETQARIAFWVILTWWALLALVFNAMRVRAECCVDPLRPPHQSDNFLAVRFIKLPWQHFSLPTQSSGSSMPFASGMDPVGIAYFKRQARLAVGRGRTILYSTQILDVAEKFSDRVCLIHRGKLRVFDAVANLHVRPGGKDGVLEDVFRQLREEEQ